MYTPVSKAEIRRQLRTRRNALSPQERTAHAEAAAAVLTGSRYWRDADTIAVYLAADGELDTNPIIRAARAENKGLFLPVILADNSLLFREWHADMALVVNRYGIAEPPETAHSAELPALALVCVPLVAWDRQGTRLGMGGGFYDRTFADADSRGLLVGLGYTLQEQTSLPRDTWDVSLDLVVTESSLISCER